MRFCIGCLSDTEATGFPWDVEIAPTRKTQYETSCPVCIDQFADIDVFMEKGRGDSYKESQFDYCEQYCADTLAEAKALKLEDPIYA